MDDAIVTALNFNAEKIEKTGVKHLSNKNSFKGNSNKVRFYTKSNFSNAVKSVAPYLKIAILCKQETFLTLGKEYVDILKGLGNKTVCYLVSDDFNFSVESACGLFNINEDVRAVLVFDHDLYALALYFASIRKISTIFVADSLYPEIFSAQIFVPNGKSVDNFILATDRCVVLNEFNAPKNQAYALIVQFSLSEFFVFDFINNSITNRSLYDYLKQEKEKIDLESLFRIYYLDLLNNGVIFQNSSLTEFSLCYKKVVDIDVALTIIDKIIKGLVSKNEKKILDYNNLAKKLEILTGEKRSLIVSKIKGQLKALKTNREKILSIQSGFILDASKVDRKIKNNNLKLSVNAKKQKEINSIYSVCGYSLGINAFTLVK